MKKIVALVLVLLAAAACEQGSGSYAQIVVVNDAEYNGTEENIEDYEIEEAIGEITKKVPPDAIPDNYQSNMFEEGTVIYAVKNNPDFIILKDGEEELYLLEKVSENHIEE